MYGKPCYIDFDLFNTDTPGVYKSYKDYAASAKNADFIVARHLYSDTARSVKLGDTVVFSIADKNTADGVLCVGISAPVSGSSNTPSYLKLVIKATEVGSTLTVGLWG